MAIDALEKFLKDKKKANEKKFSGVDWDLRLEQWKAHLDSLYGQIRGYLKQAIKAGDVELALEPIKLTEEFIGEYSINRLVISVGGERVNINPRGALIIGAFGRCDMEGEGDSMMLILHPPGGRPGVHIGQELAAGKVSMKIQIGLNDPKADISSSAWHFADRRPEMHSWPLTKKSFTEALQAVMRG